MLRTKALTIRRLTWVLLLVATAAIAVDVETNRLDAWMPNVAVGAIGLALTITVVERLLKNADAAARRTQLRGWRLRAYDEIGNVFAELADRVDDLQDLPEDDQWEDFWGLPGARARIGRWDDTTDARLCAAMPAFCEELSDIRERHLPAFDHNVIIAIDGVLRTWDRVEKSLRLPADDAPWRAKPEVRATWVSNVRGSLVGLFREMEKVDDELFNRKALVMFFR